MEDSSSASMGEGTSDRAGLFRRIRTKYRVRGQAGSLEALHDRLGRGFVGIFSLEFDLHVARERGADVLILERGLVHREAVLAPGGPEVDQHQLVFALRRGEPFVQRMP